MYTTPIQLAESAQVLVLEDFFSADLLQQIHQYFDGWQDHPEEWIPTAGFAGYRYSSQGTDPVYSEIRRYFDSDSVLAQFAQWVPGTRLFVSNFAIWVDRTGLGALAPHREQSDSRLAQIFVTRQPDSYSGTTIYSHASNQVLLQLPYRNNFGWFFDRGSTVNHGRAHAVPSGTDRFAIMAWYGDYLQQ